MQHSNSPLSFSLQCYLFAYYSVWRNSKSFLAFALICLSNMYLYELRNMWQILFHVAVGAFMTLQIRLRQPLGKAPDYNVWQKLKTQRTIGPSVRCLARALKMQQRWPWLTWGQSGNKRNTILRDQTEKTKILAAPHQSCSLHPITSGQWQIWVRT